MPYRDAFDWRSHDSDDQGTRELAHSHFAEHLKRSVLSWMRRGAGSAARRRTPTPPSGLLRADHFVGGGWRWSVARRRTTDRADAREKTSAKAKQSLHPPWGNILGGESIERQGWHFNSRVVLGEDYVQQEQYARMLRLMKHYQILGGDYDYPIQGDGPTDWLPWYSLALAIASELDESLKVIDAKPRGRTAPRWRGPEGRMLLTLVEACRVAYPGRSVRWCLEQLRKKDPGYGPLNQLVVRYYEAKAYFSSTEQARNQEPAS